MATLAEIKSPVWSLDKDGGGAIIEGIAAIRQCIDIIIRTTKGSDPLRPEFGSDVSKYQDYPVDIAIPNIKKAIIDAISMWEKRVVITDIPHTLNVSHVTFNVTYKLVDDSLNDSLEVSVNNGGISTGVNPNRLILQGFLPPNPLSYQFLLSCTLNNETILPMPPETGFASVVDLYQWVKDNWSIYGQWYLTGDSVIGYINSSYTAGSISISLLTQNRFVAQIPGLPIGKKYSLSIVVDGTTYTNTEDIFTPEQIRQWVQDNIDYLGTWKVLTNQGSFNDDFSGDFDLFTQYLAIYTSVAQNVSIDINTVDL